jgi:predicted nucleotidyltransferase
MRLTRQEIERIHHEVDKQLGPQARVNLFGSRVDDSARGGDVDLLVQVDKTLKNKALSAAQLSARLERVLEGRKVDLVLLTPDTAMQPIHREAIRTGVEL